MTTKIMGQDNTATDNEGADNNNNNDDGMGWTTTQHDQNSGAQ